MALLSNWRQKDKPMNEENDSSQLIKRIEELEAIVTGKDIVESAGWWGRFSAYQFNQRKAVEAERDQLAAENKRLDADNAKAWNQRDQILKDRNALLTQLNAGPLSSDEWQIRAIRSEAERDQLAVRLKAVRGLGSKLAAFLFYTIHDEVLQLKQLSDPAAVQQDYCETDETAEFLRREDEMDARDQAEDNELKPCPFCGGKARFLEVEEEQNKGSIVVECTGCNCCTACVFPAKADAKPHAQFLWNRRERGLDAILAHRIAPDTDHCPSCGEYLHDEMGHMCPRKGTK